MDTGGFGGGDQQPFPPPPCGACGHLGVACGPHCIFAPFFPPGSEDGFARLRERHGLHGIINIIVDMGPELGRAILQFMMNDARDRANNHVQSRISRLTNAAVLLIELLRYFPQLHDLAARAEQPESAPPAANPQDHQEAGGGRRVIRRVRGGGDHGNRGSRAEQSEPAMPAANPQDHQEACGGRRVIRRVRRGGDHGNRGSRAEQSEPALPAANPQDHQEAGDGRRVIRHVQGGGHHRNRGSESKEVGVRVAQAEASSSGANSLPAPAVPVDGRKNMIGGGDKKEETDHQDGKNE